MMEALCRDDVPGEWLLKNLRKTMKHLRRFGPADIASRYQRPRLERLIEELPGYIQAMRELLAAARSQREAKDDG